MRAVAAFASGLILLSFAPLGCSSKRAVSSSAADAAASMVAADADASTGDARASRAEVAPLDPARADAAGGASTDGLADGADEHVRDDGRSGSDAVDGGAPCRVAVADGGAVPCTTNLVGGGYDNQFCALKGGQPSCWTRNGLVADVAAPHDLMSIVIKDDIGNHEFFPTYCGINRKQEAVCWYPQHRYEPKIVGTGMRAVAVSYMGICTVSLAGAVSCPPPTPGSATVDELPPGRYVQIAMYSRRVLGLDDMGNIVGRTGLPSGPYRAVMFNGAGLIAALRTAGDIVYENRRTLQDPSPSPRYSILPGTFVQAALDSFGDICGLDAEGEVSCTSLYKDGRPSSPPPPGPFVEIAGAYESFCGLRPSGTTACWGITPTQPPEGW